jgi:hypothetical protein
MKHPSNDPLRRSPEAILREAHKARDQAIANGFRWLWRELTEKSPPSSHRHTAESTGAAR